MTHYKPAFGIMCVLLLTPMGVVQVDGGIPGSQLQVRPRDSDCCPEKGPRIDVNLK